jgi:putative ATPase
MGSFDSQSEEPSLFERGGSTAQQPLAHRMRPTSIKDYFGHANLLAPGRSLRRWIDADRIPSLLLWGPPGCGKTTLAEIIAHQTQSRFLKLSAVHSGVKEIKEAVQKARATQMGDGRSTLLFVDEIHRFNKAQQDALLPEVESGRLTLIGATTENPSYEINSALLSRLRVIRLERLLNTDLVQIIQKALSEGTRGLGGRLKISMEAIEWLAERSEGDARRALTALESVASQDLPKGLSPGVELSPEQLASALDAGEFHRSLPHDKDGEEHYNLLSALIKSLRDSDPHAGVYYLARLLAVGEDPLLLVRRLVVFASEDIGNADPRALQLAIAAKDAVEFVGLPECRINLAQLVSYLAVAPKSNAALLAIGQAEAAVESHGALPVPKHLRNASTSLLKAQGYGAGYQYAHDAKAARVRQIHLPRELVGQRFYFPVESGLEKQIKEKLDQLNPLFESE